MRVAVVGLGAVGGAALRFLAQQRHEAVGYEQFTRGHTRGSSHGESRIYRLTYAA
jgi:sarcosine oxidase